jgi:pyruvate dehydrogenase E2 component (dihydrolipoamide acetyltransferase)
MPVLGLTMEEGTVAEWLKQEGDAVKRDEPLLTVEMDKGIVEVPAPASGVLRRIVVQTGTTVPVRTLIAEIGEPGEVASAEPSAPAGAPSERPASAGGPGDLPPIEATPREVAIANLAASPQRDGGVPSAVPSRPARLFASPRARMRARAMNVDLATLHGSGPHGRIVESDVLSATSAEAAEARVVATPRSTVSQSPI